MTEYVISRSLGELMNFEQFRFVIPIYQRNYEWGRIEIEQLIQDLYESYKSFEKNNDLESKYHMGTLVVHKNNNSLEVIDGQQRLTTITLILIYFKNLNKFDKIKEYKKINLNFEYRDSSNNTLKSLLNSNISELNQEIITGYKIIASHFKGKNIDEKFLNFILNRVNLVQITVPFDTDLNKYFEIMNIRGEQLELHEILKARIISELDKIKNKKISIFFNKIWTAISNMDIYIQFCFEEKEREELFGNNWDTIPSSVEQFKTKIKKTQGQREHSTTILKIIDGDNPINGNLKEQSSESVYGSIVSFPIFLIHVLRIYTQKDLILNDKKLLEIFDENFLNPGLTEKNVWDFMYTLLKCRFLFDKFVIKRDAYEHNSWDIRKVIKNQRNRKTAKYVNSFNSDSLQKECLMLQCAFHVSYPTPTYKNWLHSVLLFLNDNYSDTTNFLREYVDFQFNLAKQLFYSIASGAAEFNWNMTDRNSEKEDTNLTHLSYSTIKNHFVFNFIDYLIWKKEQAKKINKYSTFRFVNRESIEHFAPQQPAGGKPLSMVDNFGNLCLISASTNAKLSNRSPSEKFKILAKTGLESLKQKEMLALFERRGRKWGNEEILEHFKYIEKLLKD